MDRTIAFSDNGGSLRNFGLVLHFVRFEAMHGLSQGRVYNAGSIISDWSTIQVEGKIVLSDPVNFDLVNLGRIHSERSAAFEYVGRGHSIVNSGEMTTGSSFSAVIRIGAQETGSGVGVSLFNTGLIANLSSGASTRVALNLGEATGWRDSVANRGQIVGDVLLGAGNDTFDGRGGTVQGQVLGGRGNDLFIVDDPGALIVERSGQGNDTVQAWSDFILPDHVEWLQLMGDALRGTGTRGNDTLVGNQHDNLLSGLGGADALFGDLGDDTLSGGADADVVFGGEGNDVAYGGAGADRLNGQDGDDVLFGNVGADTLSGDAGRDTLFGGTGSDALFGGEDDDDLRGNGGNDALDAGEGDDIAYGGTGADTIFGVAGDDTLFGGGGADHLYGGNDDDLLDGGHGNDWLFGGEGDDTLTGGKGNDILEGGMGADLLIGGPGFDSFVFRSSFESSNLGMDTIRGFQPGEHVVDLSRIDANTLLDGDQAFTLSFAGVFSGVAGELIVLPVLNTRTLMGDTDGDRVADFVVLFEGTPILAASSFIL